MAQAQTTAQTNPQTVPLTRHPYADGAFKRMLIDGKWVDAASGKHFESRNPATGELLATVAEGDAEDINRAVAAARKAFEGPWSKFKPPSSPPMPRRRGTSSMPRWPTACTRSILTSR